MRRAAHIAIFVACAAALGLMLGAAKPKPHRPPPPPPQPPPQVSLSLSAPLPDRGWTATLTNTGSIPVRIVADPRLFSFDVTDAGRVHHCTLPADMRPSTDTTHTIVVPPNRSWTARVDPMLYCFGAANDAALAPGATVVATFGFTPDGASPPFAITPVGATDAGVGPARLVSAPSVTLAAEEQPEDAGAADAPTDAAPSNAYPIHMEIALPARFDISRAFEQNVPLTVTNASDRTVRTLIAAPTLGFIIETPQHHVYHCGADTPATAIAELTTTLPAHGRTSQSIDLGAVCGTFLREPGLYRVRPRLDTRQTTPPPGATTFWNGEVIGKPMLLRIRNGEDAPSYTPHLDPPPPATK